MNYILLRNSVKENTYFKNIQLNLIKYINDYNNNIIT